MQNSEPEPANLLRRVLFEVSRLGGLAIACYLLWTCPPLDIAWNWAMEAVDLVEVGALAGLGYQGLRRFRFRRRSVRHTCFALVST